MGYSFNDDNGIHGWLTANETSEFSDLLKELPLPEYEMSFEALDLPRRAHRNKEIAAEGKTYSQDQFALARIRTVVRIAANRGKGVLWGNDIMDCWTEEEYALFTNPGEAYVPRRINSP